MPGVIASNSQPFFTSKVVETRTLANTVPHPQPTYLKYFKSGGDWFLRVGISRPSAPRK